MIGTTSRWPAALASVVVLVAVVAAALALASPQRQRNIDREVALMVELLDAGPGDTIADVGADDGLYSIELAPQLAPGGTVYANEVTDEKVRSIHATVEEAGVDNVTVLRGSATGTGLPAGCCDGIMLRLVYHHLADPAAMQRDLWNALRPGGLLLVIENRPQSGPDAPGVPENRSGMGIDRDIVLEELTGAGFELVRELDDWPSGRYGGHYAFVFRRPAS